MTQPSAADLLGVSLATYKRWEKGDPQQYPKLLELAIAELTARSRAASFLGELDKPVDMASQ